MALELRAIVPVKTRPGYSSRVRVALAPVWMAGGVGLGDGDVDAEPVDGGEVEELARVGAVFAGLDEGADVGVAGSDDAVEGRVDFFVGLELLEAADVGHGGVDGGLFGGGSRSWRVGLLLGDGVVLRRSLIAVGGGVGEVEVGLGALEVGLGDLAVAGRARGFRSRP